MKRGYGLLMCSVTGMFMGMIIGIAVINTLISYRIDEYHQKIEYLQNVIEEKDVRLEKLEESVNKKNFILKSVEIVLDYDNDEIEKMTLEKHIREKYTKFLGREVKSIDAEMAVEIIDRRIMMINGRIYRLKVDKLVLTEVLKIWVTVDVDE